MRYSVSILLLLAVAGIARSEVVESKESGFRVRSVNDVNAAPQVVYDAFVQDIDKWWDSKHTFSGDAANLSIQAEPHGWFLEKLPS